MHVARNKVAAWFLFTSALLLSASLGHSQAFTVAAAPSTLIVYPGQQNIPVVITVGSSAYAGPINVTVTGLPSGITVTPLTLSAGSSGTLYLNATVAAGNEGFYEGVNASWTAQVTVLAAAGSTQAIAQLPLTMSISNPSFAPAPSAINLPVVKIDTNGVGVVDKTTLVPGTISITSADGQTSYLPNASDADNTATFHVHGNSTSVMPKLPYNVKLNTSVDLLGAMGLSCPYVNSKGKAVCDKSKTYVLLANYDDKTLLRDWSASALANAIPMGNGYLSSPAGSPSPSGTKTVMPWAPHSLFVELYLNGVYEGNYQLIEKVNVDGNRINISELTESNVSGDLTGGYLLEIDEDDQEDVPFNTTLLGTRIGIEDPDFSPDPEVPEQVSYITNYVDAAESSLYASNFTDPTNGWRAYFDEASAVNFYIVNDLMGNNDGGAMWASDYFYKAVDNPLLYMGPIWDFDISSGNDSMNVIANPTVPWMQIAPWYSQWFKDPGFKADLTTQWNALKNNGVFSTWIASIQQQAKTLEQSQANNFGRWPMQGIEVWPNSEAVGSYDGEVQYFTNWLQTRLAYLDSLFNNKALTTTALSLNSGTLRNGTPVTLTGQVAGGTSPSGTVSFLSNGILIGTGSLGGGLASLTTSSLPVGANLIQAVYNGDSTNGLSASTSQSVTVAAPLVAPTISLGGPSNTLYATNNTFTAAVIPNSGTAIPTGIVLFAVDSGSGTAVTLNGSGSAAYSNSSLSVGAHTITAAYAGDTNFSPVSSQNLTVQVAVATPTVVVTSSNNPVLLANSTTFTASVTATGGQPTGTVTFLDGTTPLGQQSLSGGVATFVTSSLAVGTHTITAAYSGDPDFTPGNSSDLTQTVQDFAIAGSDGSNTTQTVAQGGTATYSFALAPAGTVFPSAVFLTVSGLPAGSIVTIGPSPWVALESSWTLPANAPLADVKMSIQTQQALAALQKKETTTSRLPQLLWGVLLLPFAGRVRKGAGRFGRAICILLLAAGGLAVMAGLSACSSNSSQIAQPPKSYVVQVTAISGNLSHSIPLTLTVE
jgi:hypothetical protein